MNLKQKNQALQTFTNTYCCLDLIARGESLLTVTPAQAEVLAQAARIVEDAADEWYW